MTLEFRLVRDPAGPFVSVDAVAECGMEYPGIAKVIDPGSLNPGVRFLVPAFGIIGCHQLAAAFVQFPKQWAALVAGEIAVLRVVRHPDAVRRGEYQAEALAWHAPGVRN